MVTAAPACKAALSEASRLWPNRRTTSDGILSSNAHQIQNPSSDHDYGNAWDLSHDPASGCDAHALVRAIVKRRDSRVKYAISNGRIWSAARANEGWRPYSGSNPHTQHAHVSVYDHRRNDTGPWFRVVAQTAVKPQPIKEDEMTPEQEAKLDRVLALLDALTAPRRPDKTDADPGRLSLADIYTKIEKDHA